MDKPKNRAVSTIRYYWDVATLAQRFEAEVEASPESIVDAFNTLGGDVVVSGMNRHFKYVRTQPAASEDAYTFDVRLIREMSPAFLPNVRAQGRIIRSEGYGTTIIRGNLSLGWLATAELIFAFLLAIVGIGWSLTLGESNSIGGFALVITLIAFGVVGMSYYSSYLIIKRDIEQIIHNASEIELESAEDNLLIDDADEALHQHTIN